jgi:molybdate transport system substrate-binding protein
MRADVDRATLCAFLGRLGYRATAMSVRTVALAAFACALLLASTALHAQVPAIAAASDLQFALSEAAVAFRRATGDDVRIAFGSSGNFTQQIENGAPFELFLSADEAYIERLAAKGFARDAGTLYAVGRIVLFVPQGSPLKLDATLNDLRAAAGDGRVKRFAIANPEHAPYGRAAREALTAAGIWEAIQPRLVLGESASQAMQFAAAGGAQGGIVPYSLAKAGEMSSRGAHVLLSDRTHAPLRQRMALMKRAGPIATRFHDWLQQREAREIFVRYGFALPGE